MAGRAQALADFSQQSAPFPRRWAGWNGTAAPPSILFRGKLDRPLCFALHIPKDGDSAGTAFTWRYCRRSRRPLRRDFTITGAISQEGKIQSVGGIADKVTKSSTSGQNHFPSRENENDLLSHLLKSPTKSTSLSPAGRRATGSGRFMSCQEPSRTPDFPPRRWTVLRDAKGAGAPRRFTIRHEIQRMD
ncbi:MAG: hypothetical protein IPH91_10890 [Elusimicrobia bacterium]|nr:hypothetical protein [Elusimicrobiota bacterium]